MKRWFRTLSILFSLVVLIGLASFYWMHSGVEKHPNEPGNATHDAEKAASNGPVACVKVIPLEKKTISEHLIVYGTVIPAPGALQTVSLPFESQVLSIVVSNGQKVAKGDLLLRLQPSPETALQLDQARNAYDSQQENMRQVQRRFDSRLATNEQLLQARQALDEARLRLTSLTKRGVDSERKIAAAIGGLVEKVHVQEGTIVPAGNPLIEIVEQDRFEVLIGVELEDIARVNPDQEVLLARTNMPASPKVTGHIRRISYAVNPSTRLVDVFVSIASPGSFFLSESVNGEITTTAVDGMVVPKSVVLAEGDQHVVFIVQDARAVKRAVEIGVENADEFEILGKDLKAGEQVVVLGNYELLDGMQVTTEGCK